MSADWRVCDRPGWEGVNAPVRLVPEIVEGFVGAEREGRGQREAVGRLFLTGGVARTRMWVPGRHRARTASIDCAACTISVRRLGGGVEMALFWGQECPLCGI